MMASTEDAQANELPQEGAMTSMPPDHALLQRAQLALKAQLLEIQQDLADRVREKQKALKAVILSVGRRS